MTLRLLALLKSLLIVFVLIQQIILYLINGIEALRQRYFIR